MKCKEPGCGKEIIFTITRNGKMMPTDLDSLTDLDMNWLLNREDEKAMLMFRFGEHVSHFATCTKPSKFRREDDSPKKQE